MIIVAQSLGGGPWLVAPSTGRRDLKARGKVVDLKTMEAHEGPVHSILARGYWDESAKPTKEERALLEKLSGY